MAGCGDKESNPEQLTCDHDGFTVFSERAFDLGGSAILIEQRDSDQDTFRSSRIELWAGVGNDPSLGAPGTYILGSSADERDYATCGTCVVISTGCSKSDSSCTKEYFAISGTLMVTDVGGPGNDITGTITDLVLVEISTNPGKPWVTTEVEDGEVFCVEELPFGTEVLAYCEADAACVGSPHGDFCLVGESICVECLVDATCNEPIGEVCATDTHLCGIPPECMGNTDCTSNPKGELCDTTRGVCVECVASADCTDANETVCDTANDVCAQCLTDADCFDVQYGPTANDTYGSAGACDPQGSCYFAPECTMDADCAGATVSTCNPSTGRCSE